MSDRDICERLQAIADLQPGDDMPSWLYSADWAPGSWAAALSRLLNEAIAEIRSLRERLQ